MDTALLKAFATSARTELIREVGARITAVLAPGSPERVEQPQAVAALELAISADGGGDKGKQNVINKVAYTWFNRIIALRFMDANGYTGIGVVSPASDQIGQPEVLAAAKRGQIDGEVVNGADAANIAGLLDGTRHPRPGVDAQAEAYSVLLADYCRYWNRSMPFMFERDIDFTELLIPANLLAEDSVLSRSVEVLTEDVCQDVEVIGWLYQFYISERKDEVFAGFKKNKKAGADEIPAATQLFTPHWIVRYLVENSVGRVWMLNHPESQLIDQMDYYIAPVDKETDFLKITTPEELTVIDPACGSGHMLTYAFDLLYAIYEEEGHAPSQIPGLILTNNLFGTEIDPRAAALAAFALTMKAAARRRRFLKDPVEPNVCVIEALSFRSDEIEVLNPGQGGVAAAEAFWNQFQHADTFGSLIRPDLSQKELLERALEQTNADNDLIYSVTLERARRFNRQAEMLANRYAVVVANPPYMGSKQMNALLSQFMKAEYPNSKSDLFAGFIERCLHLAMPRGFIAMITMQSWMFLSSYERLRISLITHQHITSMLHLGTRAFDSIGGEVVSSTAFVLANVKSEANGRRSGIFIRLVDGTSESEKSMALATALENRAKNVGFYLASGSDFEAIPGSPIVYWLSEKMRAAFGVGVPLAETIELLVGLRTGDNNRFMRLWWEVSRDRTKLDCATLREAKASGCRWFPYNKGGAFRRWYGNQEYVINWENDGLEIEEGLAERYPYMVPRGKTLVRGQGREQYFSPSVSWSDISSGEAAFRRYPQGFIHDSTGHSGFGEGDILDRTALLLNSKFVTGVMQVVAPTLHFHIGYVGLVPVAPAIREIPAHTAESLVQTSRDDWDQYETSWNFQSNPLLDLR